jgi:hypothetical protein
MSEISVADGVLATAYSFKKAGKLSLSTSKANALQILPGCKKLEYNQAVCDLVDKTRSVDIEEILPQLQHVSFPFDQFWIEGPPHTIYKNTSTRRHGYLVSSNQDEQSFQFQLFYEIEMAADRFQILKDGNSPFLRINEKTYPSYDSTPSVTMDGINLDESVLEEVEKYAEARRTKGTAIGISSDPDKALTLIDELFNAADFLARLFTVMSALKIQPEMHPEEVYQQERLSNLRRLREKFPPKLTVRPIPIDLTKIDTASFNPQSQKELRELLGWTSVRRSREIVSKHGKIFRRKPHDRRIAAPEDRRNAVRQLTAGETGLTLALGKGAPILSRPGQ